MKIILTAKEQFEALSPWRVAAENQQQVQLYGGGHIADILGVRPNALQNWRVRYHGTERQTPTPTHLVVDGMPLWDDNGLKQWQDWHATHKGV